MAAVVASVGATVFTAAELVAHARVDRDLDAAVRGYTAKRLGKRLRALADHPIAGCVLRRVGRDHAGTIWAVQVVDDLHGGPCPGEDSRA